LHLSNISSFSFWLRVSALRLHYNVQPLRQISSVNVRIIRNA